MITMSRTYSIVLSFLPFFIPTFNVSYALDIGAYLPSSEGFGILGLFIPQLQELIFINHIFYFNFLIF